jgi:hypothetical protein
MIYVYGGDLGGETRRAWVYLRRLMKGSGRENVHTRRRTFVVI